MSLSMAFARRRMMTNGVSAVDPILNNNPWDVISAIATAGEGANWWSVGDRKAVVLNGTVGSLSLSNYTIYAFIIGFDHNAELEGSGRIHFQFGKTALSGGTGVALCDDQYGSSVSGNYYFHMKNNTNNSGGWASSTMRAYICGTSLTSYSGTIIAVIPEELRSVLVSVTKYTDNVGGASGDVLSNITSTTDYFFLLSEYEVFGSCTYSNSNEASKQKRYAYYSAGNSRVMYRHNSTASTAYWFLRSPRKNAVANYASVGNSGGASISYADRSCGVAPGFCVGGAA